MESRGAHEPYLVFCADARARELQGTPWLKQLETECRVRLEQIPGGFLIHRQGTSVQLQQQCKHLLINLIKSGAVARASQWFWFNGRSYSPYDIESNTLIEQHFQQSLLQFIIHINGKPYQLDLARWRQVDMTTGMWRPVVRNPPPATNAPSGWCFFDRNTWRKVPDEISQAIVAAEGQTEVQVTMQSRVYELRLKQKEMRDVQADRIYKLEFFRPT